LCEQEGEIDQNRQARGDGRLAALAHSYGFRRISQISVILAALVLITLAWAAAHEAIRAHRTEELARVRMEALGAALAIEEQLRRELLTLDQALNILEYVWERDPTHFDLATWSSHVSVLSDVSLQLFISDARGIVHSSTRPAIIGTDVSGRDYFRHEEALPADDDKMFVGSLTQGQVTYGRSTWSADWTIRTALLPA
jgi:hypothetical protein